MLSPRSTQSFYRRSKTSGAVRSPLIKRMTVFALFVVICANILMAQPMSAASGDFSIDFAAAAPKSYNHLTGGGAFDDGTIGVANDVVESLEGGDFACGNIVTFFAEVTVADTAQAALDAPQTIEMDFSFLADTTGQSGVALGDIVYVGVNRGTIEDLIPGENTVDDGNVEDGGSVATLISESLTGPLFVSGSELLGTVKLTDLERGEQVIVRIDVKLYCKPNSGPTGNLQADLEAARLTYINENVTVSPPAAISGGAQTIPFKQVGNIAFPAIEVVKTVTTESGACPGTNTLVVGTGVTVKYCYVVSNPSNVTDPPGAPLYNVTLTDDHGTPGDTSDDFAVTVVGLTDIDGDGVADDLAPGASASGYALIAMPSSDATVINTVTAVGYDSIILPTPYSDKDTATVIVTFAAVPAIDVEKYVSVDNGTTWVDADVAPGPILPLGMTPQFKFVVTNIGNVELSEIGLSDNVFVLSGCVPPRSLPVNESFVCNITGIFVLGQHTNLATVSGNYEETPVGDTDPANFFGMAPPDISVDKSVLPEIRPEPGGVFTFKVVVENHSVSPVNLTSLVDDIYGDLTDITDETGTARVQLSTTCVLPQALAAADGDASDADKYTCEFSAEVFGNAGYTETDTVTATAVNDVGTDTATDTATVSLTDVLPDIEVTKTATPTSVPETGSDVVFIFVVENIGVEDVTLTTLSDSVFGDLNGQGTCVTGGLIPVGGSYSCSITKFLASDSLLAHYDVVTAVGTDDDGSTDTDTDDETITFTDVTFALVLTKTVEQTGYSQVGEVLTYQLVVENIGNGTLTNVTITDPKLGDLVCQPAQPATLLPGEKMTCMGDYVVAQGDIDEGEVVNVATAESNESEPDEDEAEVPAVVTPGLSIIKTGDAGPVTIGDIVHYTITVKNTGNVTLHDVIVTDTKLGINQNVGTLAPGQEVQLTGTYGPISEVDLPGPVLNTAIVVGKTPKDEPVGPETDSHEVPLVATPKLVLVKTASPTVYSEVGETINYSYKLTNMGNVTLYAPFTVSDTKAAVTCPPTPVSLAPGESIVCTASYVIAGVDLQTGSVTNVAEGKAKGPQGEDITSNKDEETVVYVPLPATLGDRVWLDKNHNGVQDADEVGVAGVKVDLYTEGGAFVATTTTDAAGNYLFTPLAAGGYTVEFTAPDGYRFTLHDASNNSLDATDSDPLVPNLEVGVSDGGVEPELGGPLSYTFTYTNSDPVLTASGVVITAKIPEGTSYLATGSTPGWVCTAVEAGGFCRFTLPTLAANSAGSVTFVVLLKETDSLVPDQLDMLVTITQSTVGRTPVIVLAAGEDNRTVDAGVFTTESSSWQTPTPTEPTNLPVDDQPDVPEQQYVYLPPLALDKE